MIVDLPEQEIRVKGARNQLHRGAAGHVSDGSVALCQRRLPRSAARAVWRQLSSRGWIDRLIVTARIKEIVSDIRRDDRFVAPSQFAVEEVE